MCCFTPIELTPFEPCPGAGAGHISVWRSWLALEGVRAEMGAPLLITSGHRCRGWNAAVGGAPLSQHKSIAADVVLSGHDRFALLAAAERAGFTGFGLARTFLHIDRRARPARWFYPGSEALWKR